jgi:hypothetical protein
MKDINTSLVLDNDNLIATGSIKVIDYSALIGTVATGSVKVDSYANLVGAKATLNLTVTAYASLTGAVVTVKDVALTEGVEWTAATSNNATATSLASAIDAITGVGATASSAVITVEASAAGKAGNLIGTACDSDGLTVPESHLLGGKNHATVKIGATTLTQGTGFTASVSNASTATSLAAGIHAIAGLSASVDLVDDTLVLIETDAIGADKNVELAVTWDEPSFAGLTTSGATLTGGRDEGVFTIDGTDYEQGTDFTASTDEDTTATSIATITIAGFTIAVDGTDTSKVNITSDTIGTAGNLLITTNASDGVEVTTMTGGADYAYSDVFEYDGETGVTSIESSVKVVGLTLGDTADIVLQVSFDKVTWADAYAYPQFTTDGTADKLVGSVRAFARLQGSVSASATATVTWQALISDQDVEDGATSTVAMATDIATINGKIPAKDTAGADGVSNTKDTTPTSARQSVFNGTTWDRARGDATNGTLVNLGTNNDVTVTSGAITETNSGAIKTAIEIIDDWDNGASDGASVSGDTAHDAVDAGEPVKIGGRASTSTPSAVAGGDRVDAFFDEFGRLHVRNMAYDSGSTSDKVSEVFPLNSQVAITSRVDAVDIAAATNYYPSSSGATMDLYSDLSASGKFIDADGTVTLSLEVTNDEDPATADWVKAYFRDDKNDINVNEITVTDGTVTFAVHAVNCNYKYYRWVVVNDGATNTVILKERVKAIS